MESLFFCNHIEQHTNKNKPIIRGCNGKLIFICVSKIKTLPPGIAVVFMCLMSLFQMWYICGINFCNLSYNHIILYASAFQTPYLVFYQSKGFIVGNNSTSLMLALSVSNITNLSSPMPRPPVGGKPYSRAVMKSSSI